MKNQENELILIQYDEVRVFDEDRIYEEGECEEIYSSIQEFEEYAYSCRKYLLEQGFKNIRLGIYDDGKEVSNIHYIISDDDVREVSR